jgi:hypothetical protein
MFPQTDSVIKCGEAIFPVHQRILKLNCQLLNASTESNVYQNGILNLDRFSVAAVQRVIDYVYEGSLPDDITFDELDDLCELADYLDIEDLRDYCEKT